jgi:hypothetical protein
MNTVVLNPDAGVFIDSRLRGSDEECGLCANVHATPTQESRIETKKVKMC